MKFPVAQKSKQEAEESAYSDSESDSSDDLGSATALPTGQFWAVGSVQWAVQPALHCTAHKFQWAGRLGSAVLGSHGQFVGSFLCSFLDIFTVNFGKFLIWSDFLA